MAEDNRKLRHRPPVFQDSGQDSLVFLNTNNDDLSWLRSEDRKFFDDLADMAGSVGKHLRLPETRFIDPKSVEPVTRICSAPSSTQNLVKSRNEYTLTTVNKKHHQQSAYYKRPTSPKQLAIVKKPQSPIKERPPSVRKPAEERKSPVRGPFLKNSTLPAQNTVNHHHFHQQHHRRQEQQQKQQLANVEKPKAVVRRPPTKPLSPKRNHMELKKKEIELNRFKNSPPKNTADSSRGKETPLPKRPLSQGMRGREDPRNNISNRMGRCNLNNPYYTTSTQQPKIDSPGKFRGKKEDGDSRKKKITKNIQPQIKNYAPTCENQFFSCSEEMTDFESFGCNDDYGGETTTLLDACPTDPDGVQFLQVRTQLGPWESKSEQSLVIVPGQVLETGRQMQQHSDTELMLRRRSKSGILSSNESKINILKEEENKSCPSLTTVVQIDEPPTTTLTELEEEEKNNDSGGLFGFIMYLFRRK